jgi:hypothetical protein
MHVRLNLIDRLLALEGAEPIILPDDVVPNLWEIAAVREVIRACGSRCGHPFFFVNDCEIDGDEDWIKPSPRELARSWKAKS